MILEKTVLYLIHNCLKFANCQDDRLKYPNRIFGFISRKRVVTFSAVFAFVHDRFKMVYRDLRYQGDDCLSTSFVSLPFRSTSRGDSPSRVYDSVPYSFHTLLLW